MKRPERIYPLILLMASSTLICFVSAHMSLSGGGALPINYVPSGKGTIMFDVDFTSTQVYFSDGYLMMNNWGTFNSIGFSCETESANMTVTKVASDEIAYTVNAATDVTSTTKICVGSKGRPTEVSGSTSWSYSSALKVVTVSVLHQSPADIVFVWENAPVEEDKVGNWLEYAFYPIVEMMGLTLVVMGAALVFGAMNNTFDMKVVIDILKVAMIMAIGIWIAIRL